jgi:hypothetical protein
MAFHSILLVSTEFGAFAFGQTGFGFGDSDLGIGKSNINSQLNLCLLPIVNCQLILQQNYSSIHIPKTLNPIFPYISLIIRSFSGYTFIFMTAKSTKSKKRKSRKIPVKKLLLEFFSILVAITLALAANEWRQIRSNKALVKRVMETLQQEVIRNKESITLSKTYRAQLINELQRGEHLVGKIPYPTANTQDFKGLRTFIYKTARRMQVPLSPDFDFEKVEEGKFQFTYNNSFLRVYAKQDTLFLYGDGNIQLRSPAIANTSWELAQATGALVHMNYTVVEKFSEMYELHNSYQQVISHAIQILYTNQGSILSTLQDMHYYETLILEKYDELLALLE